MSDKLKEGAKFDGEKTRLDLMPPNVIESIGRILTHGAAKYEDRNWEKGIKFSRVYGALLRHIFAWWEGEDLDPESGMPHLWHMGCNATFLIHYINNDETFKEYDDRPGGKE